jgi:hypothetical protein
MIYLGWKAKTYEKQRELGALRAAPHESTATKPMRNDYYTKPPSGDGAWS